MVEKKPKGSGQSKDSLKSTKALNLNTKAAKANSKQLQSLTKKLGSSFTSLNSTMKSSNGKVTKAIGTNTKSISTNTKSLKGLSKAITSLTQSNTKGEKKTPKPKPMKDEDKTPKPKPGKDEDKTPTPPVNPPIKPPKPTKDPETENEGLNQNIGLQTAVMGKLTGAIMNLWSAQGDMVKTFHRFGKQNMIGFSQISKTMSADGLSLAANLAVHSEMFNVGLGEYSRSLGTYTDGLSQPKLRELQVKTLAQYKNLGLDSKALAGFLAHNSQVIGGSASKSIALADEMAVLGATYGISTDKLVSALQNLSTTFMKSASVFGAETSQAGQQAIASMIGKFGTGQQANLEKMARTLMSGTNGNLVR